MQQKQMFKAKVNKSGKTYHFWKRTECRGLFAAICNPGLTRAGSELHETKSGDTLCKVCAIHHGGK